MVAAQEVSGHDPLRVTFADVQTPQGEVFSPSHKVIDVLSRSEVSDTDRQAFYHYFHTLKQALVEVLTSENRTEGFPGLLTNEALASLQPTVEAASEQLSRALTSGAQLSSLRMDTNRWVKTAIRTSRIDEVYAVIEYIENQLGKK